VAKTINYGTNIAGLNRALRRFPKDVQIELKDASQEAAGNVAATARGLAASLVGRSGGWRYLGPTIKATRSSKPTIKMGGTRPLPGRGRRPDPERQKVGDLTFGLEYGGGRFADTRQFLPHRGNKGDAGYALWPAVRGEWPENERRYLEALDDAMDKMA
jgi:hypothetical protein